MKRIPIFCLTLLLCLTILTPALAETNPMTPHTALITLKVGNAAYLQGDMETDTSPDQRAALAAEGQAPYAVIVTCSDSRVPPEHLFAAGLGELFVVRTAGNVVDDFAIGSVEYGAAHLAAPLVVVLGHSGCGAVAAALEGHADGAIEAIVHEIAEGIGAETDAAAAEDLNIAHTRDRLLQSEALAGLVESGALQIVCAKYDLHTGAVTFWEE